MGKKERLNLPTNLWGEKAWVYLHSVALGYPINPTQRDKQDYKSFFYHMGLTLPCEKCRNHFRKHWNKKKIDPYLESPEKIFEWTVILRNEVNKSKGNKKRYNHENLKKNFLQHIMNRENFDTTEKDENYSIEKFLSYPIRSAFSII